MSKQVRPSQESPSSLSPLPTAARPLSPRDLQSQASDVPFKDVHVVGWEDDLLASPTDTSATLFVITISTNKPLPANMNAPSSHALCIRRSFEEFFAFNAKLQDHLLHAKNQDAILLDKKRKQSLSFLTLPKRRKVTTQEDNEERVTLLDMYLQDVMSLSPVIWSLDFINDFFSPSPSDWEATRRRIQPDQVKARSNWRPGALFRPITLGRRNGNSDSRDVRGKTSNPPPTANIFSSNPSKGTLYSGEGNPAAITGNGILTLKPKNKGRRVGFAGDDDAPLEEDWLAPIEQRRRMSRQMNDLSSDDSNRRGSLLPKIQSANDETVSSSALNQVISALYDEAAKGPPRNSVVARKFVVASAVADADLQGGEVNAPLYNQVLASLNRAADEKKRQKKREELTVRTSSDADVPSAGKRVTKKKSRPLPQTPINVGTRSTSLAILAGQSDPSPNDGLARSNSESKASLPSREPVNTKPASVKNEVLDVRARSGSAPIQPQPLPGSARPPISARSSSRLDIVPTSTVRKSDVKDLKVATAPRQREEPAAQFEAEESTSSRSPSPPPPFVMSAGPQSGGLLAAPKRRVEPKVLVADGAIVQDLQSEPNGTPPPLATSSPEPPSTPAPTPATVAAQLTSYLAKLTGYGNNPDDAADDTEEKRRTVASYAYDDEDENAFETMTNITGPLIDDGNFWAPTTRRAPTAPAPRRPVSSLRESVVSRREDAPIVIKRGLAEASRPASIKEDQSVMESTVALSEITPSEAVGERRTKRLPEPGAAGGANPYPNIPARNSSSLDVDLAALAKAARSGRRGVGADGDARGDTGLPGNNRRKNSRIKVTTAWVNDVSQVKEQRAPPPSFIGQAFGDFSKRRGSSFADAGSFQDDKSDPEAESDESGRRSGELSNDYTHNKVSNQKLFGINDNQPSWNDRDDPQWRSGSMENRSPLRDADPDLYQRRRDRANQIASEKLINPIDYYKNSREDSRNGAMADFYQRDDARFSPRDEFRSRDGMPSSSTPSPSPDPPQASKGKSSLRSMVIGTINRTLRRNKSNLNENTVMSAQVISDPVGLENSRRPEKMEPIPLRPEEDFRVVTLDRGRARTVSRPSDDSKSRSPSRGTPNVYRSRSMSRPKVKEIVANAADGPDNDAGPTIDAVAPWNRTAAVVREITRSGGASLDSGRLQRNNTADGSRLQEWGRRYGDADVDYPEDLPPDDVVQVYPSSLGRLPPNSAPLWSKSLPTAPKRNDFVEGSSGDRYEQRPLRKGATVTSSPYDRLLSRSAGGIMMDSGEGPTLLERVDPRRPAPARSPSGSRSVRDWEASAPANLESISRPWESRGASPPATRRRSPSRERPARSSSLRRNNTEKATPPRPAPSKRFSTDDEYENGNDDDEDDRGRGRSNRERDVSRRSALLRSHSLGGPTTRREIEDRFVQVKAYFLMADFFVAVKISRNITFASLVRKLEEKATALLDGAGDDRVVIDSFEYVDPEGTPIIVADEEDWGVCLSDTDAKLTIKCITA